MHVDAVIELADPDRRLARDFAGAAAAGGSRGAACGRRAARRGRGSGRTSDPTRSSRVHTTDAGNFLRRQLDADADRRPAGAWATMAISPPADRFLTLISCCSPEASVSLPTRSIADMRSSVRRSAGRGTAVDSDTVVEFERASLDTVAQAPDRLRISDANMLITPPGARNSRQNGTLWTLGLKERFDSLDRGTLCCARGRTGRGDRMTQPRLLLIDDEPALADFLANAARECGFEPRVTSQRPGIPRAIPRRHGPRWSRSTSACRGWTASSCCASSPTKNYRVAGADRQRVRPPRARIPPFALAKRSASTWPGRSKSRSASKSSKRS